MKLQNYNLKTNFIITKLRTNLGNLSLEFIKGEILYYCNFVFHKGLGHHFDKTWTLPNSLLP